MSIFTDMTFYKAKGKKQKQLLLWELVLCFWLLNLHD